MSMLPSLESGQRLWAARIRHPERLKHGDIVTFASEPEDRILIKRIIALSGDIVHVHRDGSVFLNGKRLEEPYVSYPGGPSGAFEVPANHFFVMGDNRAGSQDSRHWSNPYVAEDDLVGRIIGIRSLQGEINA